MKHFQKYKEKNKTGVEVCRNIRTQLGLLQRFVYLLRVHCKRFRTELGNRHHMEIELEKLPP